VDAWLAGKDEVEPEASLSECCSAAIDMSRADGVIAGSCKECSNWVRRINPNTGEPEKATTKTNPWTDDGWQIID
jgi:hypothetical protein